MAKIQYKGVSTSEWFDSTLHPGNYLAVNAHEIVARENLFRPNGGTEYRVVLTEDTKPVNKPDMVNAPAHYTRLDPQPIEVIEAWDLDFFMGSALKYIARAGFKDGVDKVEDLEKAISFIKRRVLALQGKSVVHDKESK